MRRSRISHQLQATVRATHRSALTSCYQLTINSDTAPASPQHNPFNKVTRQHVIRNGGRTTNACTAHLMSDMSGYLKVAGLFFSTKKWPSQAQP
jgi:hypothetical protein